MGCRSMKMKKEIAANNGRACDWNSLDFISEGFILSGVQFRGGIMQFPCSQKRGGHLYINDNEVNNLGVYRNITGFVPQVCGFCCSMSDILTVLV